MVGRMIHKSSLELVETHRAHRVLEGGTWRMATEDEEEQLQDCLRRDREMEAQAENEDLERWGQYQAAVAQSWERRRVVQDLGTWLIRATETIWVAYNVKDDQGTVVGQCFCDVTAAAASKAVTVESTITDMSDEPTSAERTLGEDEQDIGRRRAMPRWLKLLKPWLWRILRHWLVSPGVPQEIVSAWYRLFLERAIEEEMVPDRFGSSVPALFQQRRDEREGGPILDPGLFTKTSSLESLSLKVTSNEAAFTAFDVETLGQFRMELRLQGGVTSPLEHDASAVPRETMRGENGSLEAQTFWRSASATRTVRPLNWLRGQKQSWLRWPLHALGEDEGHGDVIMPLENASGVERVTPLEMGVVPAPQQGPVADEEVTSVQDERC